MPSDYCPHQNQKKCERTSKPFIVSFSLMLAISGDKVATHTLGCQRDFHDIIIGGWGTWLSGCLFRSGGLFNSFSLESCSMKVYLIETHSHRFNRRAMWVNDISNLICHADGFDTYDRSSFDAPASIPQRTCHS